MHWELHLVGNRGDLAELPEDLGSLTESADAPSIKHDPRYLVSKLSRSDSRLQVWILRDDKGSVIGLAPALSESTKLVLALGPVVLRRIPLRRLVMDVEPAFAPFIGPSQRRDLSANLLSTLANQSGEHSMFMLKAVALESPLMQLASQRTDSETRKLFLPVRHGKYQRHFRASLPVSFDEFLARFSKTSQKDFRRTLARIEKESGGDWSLKSYTATAEVTQFVEAAMAVSDKTWQAQQKQAGLRHRQGLECNLFDLAGLGWFRGYVLFLREQPIGFKLGYLYRGSYFSETTGYDPEHRKLQIGVVMFLKIVEDLMIQGLAPNGFDFDSTENELKRRLSDQADLEGSYYLFPRTWRGYALAGALGAVNWLSDLGARILQWSKEPITVRTA